MSTALRGTQSQWSLRQSFKAESAITKKLAVIAGTAADEVDMPSAANDQAVGIATETVSQSADVEVITSGPADAIAGGAIARGALVGIAGTSGKLAAITVGATTGDQRVVGKAMTAAAADNDEFVVFVTAAGNDFVAV